VDPAKKALAATEIPKLDGAGIAAVLKIVVEIGRRSHRRAPRCELPVTLGPLRCKNLG
jgi:hypothetical protein